MQNNRNFLKPENILRQLPLFSGINVADLGCGHGYFSLPLAKFVPDGKVYAVDVVEEALEAVRSKTEIEGLNNIETVRANLEKTNGNKLEDESMDMVILANILFQSEKKKQIIEEAKRILKPEGDLVIIDWVAGSSMAPKEGWLVSQEKAQKMAEEKDFKLDQILEIDKQHYGLVFKKINED